MFFPKRIKKIRPRDRVLEIGPGSMPFPRANEFLEYDFHAGDIIRQRGDVHEEPDYGGRKVTRYKGNRLPFRDGEFDYVIASHVIEHVEDPARFLDEICRVGGGGYLEFPLPTYEYLYDFDVHKHFIWFDSDADTIKFLPKSETGLDSFSVVTDSLKQGLTAGWDDLVASNLDNFFAGIEFSEGLKAVKAQGLDEFDPLAFKSLGVLSKGIKKVLRFL
ncbi:class I SAM-dependent methyltransferase [Oryzomonas rubra]|uniref:SAM-dependent methyltransferase n=1 Tax=Oryzomonas rubra TaxID=2509454 RepID=A0A5A9XDR5_9BACT|nr:methyltransferase domain-containing protein [Oryzomonas rubra]KAA0891237.1 SAM-dependent methyltransferase [Oryzomonas rubra]